MEKLENNANKFSENSRENQILFIIILTLFVFIIISIVLSFILLGIIANSSSIPFSLLLIQGAIFIFTGILVKVSISKIRKLQKALNAREKTSAQEVNYKEEVLEALLRSVNAKDSYTYQHSQRVAYYSKLLAINARVSPEEAERIFIAAKLHDIGKIGMKDSILNKPDKLSDFEYVTAKEHVIVGARIVNNLEYLQDIVPIIKHHHERYDGKGYPEGLKGNEIPLGSKIITICDSFDAMTSDREYHKGIPPEEAVEFLMNNIGTQYDPDLCLLFADIISAQSNLHQDIVKKQ